MNEIKREIQRYLYYTENSKCIRLFKLNQLPTPSAFRDPFVKNTKLIAPGSGSKFPVSVNIRRLHRVCERRRFRKSAHKRDKSVHDGVMALAWGGAPLLGNNGAGGSRAPEFEGGGGRRAGGGDCGEGGGGDGAEGATTCF